MNTKNARSAESQIPFDHSELLHRLNALEEEYPFLEVAYLGASVLDRGIPLIKIGGGRRGVLYVGAHHGMEWITSAILLRFLREIAYAAKNGTHLCHLQYRGILDTHTIYVIPMLNPDGVEYQIHGVGTENPLRERLLEMNGGSDDFSRWQANARGVDLNHNYDAGFEEYLTLAEGEGIAKGAPTRYAGPAPESEPETRALCNFIRYHEELVGVMTLHTQGREIYYRSEECPPRAERIASRLSRISGYRLAHPEGLAALGGLTDWCIRALALPSFTVECGLGENPLPYHTLPSVYAELREALFTFPILL